MSAVGPDRSWTWWQALAAATLGIEPARGYHAPLRAKGHALHAYCADAAVDWAGKVDLAVCFSVIEHVDDPVQLLRDTRTLLRPGGEVLLSTPNLRDWLLELLPADYGSFFYRTVHTWYFDDASLTALAGVAGCAGCTVRSVHRFDLSNALLWLRDRRASGALHGGGIPGGRRRVRALAGERGSRRLSLRHPPRVRRVAALS